MAWPITDIPKKDVDWPWDNIHGNALRVVEKCLLHVPFGAAKP